MDPFLSTSSRSFGGRPFQFAQGFPIDSMLRFVQPGPFVFIPLRASRFGSDGGRAGQGLFPFLSDMSLYVWPFPAPDQARPTHGLFVGPVIARAHPSILSAGRLFPFLFDYRFSVRFCFPPKIILQSLRRFWCPFFGEASFQRSILCSPFIPLAVGKHPIFLPRAFFSGKAFMG